MTHFEPKQKIITVTRAILTRDDNGVVPVSMIILNTDFLNEEKLYAFCKSLKDMWLIIFNLDINIKILGNFKNTNIPYNQDF